MDPPQECFLDLLTKVANPVQDQSPVIGGKPTHQNIIQNSDLNDLQSGQSGQDSFRGVYLDWSTKKWFKHV